MIITEQMACPVCLDKARRVIKGISTLDTTRAEYTLTRHTWATVGRSQRKLVEKLYRDEWLLFIKTIGAPRVWSFPAHPTSGSGRVEYIGSYDTRLMNYDGILKSGQHMNPNDHFRSNLAILAQGVGRLTRNMVGRAEVLLLSPQRGSLSHGISLMQREPQSCEYDSAPISIMVGEHPYSLHKHTWRGGDHYDLRIQYPHAIDEWSIGVHPLEIEPQGTPTLRKRCVDPTWMTFSGERVVEGVNTVAKLLDTGTLHVTYQDDDTMNLNIGDATLIFTMKDSDWTVTKT